MSEGRGGLACLCHTHVIMLSTRFKAQAHMGQGPSYPYGTTLMDRGPVGPVMTDACRDAIHC